MTTRNLAVSHKYQKKTHLQHIQDRPDTYIGSCTHREDELWVWGGTALQKKHITYVPGLLKIFDEILVNAADNKQRDSTMKYIKVTVERDRVVIENDGAGVPIEIHSEHDVYIPQMVFGELLTGDNYDDEEDRVVGGKNGYGAKLTNIFSLEFQVETVDANQKYKQTWTQNMSIVSTPKITSTKRGDYTRITFKPDFEKFGMTEFTDDMLALLKKRVYDVAGTTPKDVRVYYNSERLPVQNFKQYCELYTSTKLVHEVINDRWEVCVTMAGDQQFQQVSFCNSICTTNGGEHVKYITDAVSKKLANHLKSLNVKSSMIARSMFVFVNALIVNPSFDSQSKQTLTTRSQNFGPVSLKPKIADTFLRKIIKHSGIVDEVKFFVQAKSQRQLEKKSGGSKKIKISVPKLDDANFAGGRRASQCTLILTEGDSAKTLAIAGLSVIGRDNFGVFPLKGKLLNVRDASNSTIIKNTEVQNIMKIMGLRIGKTYDDVQQLRYGRIMVMTDQDYDGSHIKGLIINLFHHFWPTLLRLPNFLQFFITPIVKCTRGNQTQVFFTTNQFYQWKRDQEEEWKIKYYKGLGTSNAKEAKEYFSNLGKHLIPFETLKRDGEDLIDMCFNKKRVADRKNWIEGYNPNVFVNFDVDEMRYADFVHREYIVMAVQSNLRSIPSVVDGLKPSQRKILFACLKRQLTSEIKVAQLAGYVSEHAAYHHGEMSLNGAIVNMAQHFVGSNNVHLLEPNGQFGTRLAGGKDSASPRYIFTQLSDIATNIFHPHDEQLYSFQYEDGKRIEPSFYVPVLPMLLINGSSGIGTGFSTFVPSFNPLDIIDRIRCMLNNATVEGMLPFYHGFKGTIARGHDQKYKVSGVWKWSDASSIHVTDLPIGTWTNKYKDFLEHLVESGNNFFAKGDVISFESNYTDIIVDFKIHLSREGVSKLSDNDAVESALQLTKTIDMGNMHAFDSNGQLRKYSNELEILSEFFHVRLELYQQRIEHLQTKLEEKSQVLGNKIKFIELVVSGNFIFLNKNKEEIVEQFGAHAFAPNSHQYLLNMPMWNLTQEKKELLKEKYHEIQQDLKVLSKTTPSQMWERDLSEIEKQLKLERDSTINKRKKK
jgi:DNA topoisomerase-2